MCKEIKMIIADHHITRHIVTVSAIPNLMSILCKKRIALM